MSQSEAAASRALRPSDAAAPRAPDGPRSGASPRGADGITPMMTQYLKIKAAHPDFLLFYRMGDFYELFFEDAVAAAGALDITLTRRGKHEGQDIPMCGVPVHSAESYLARLIRRGFRVAVAEQTEDPAVARKRGAKALVRREVVRVVTPGTLTEDTLLDARRHNYLAALAEAGGALGLAWLDMSTGDFSLQPLAPDGMAAALVRLDPGELLVPEGLLARPGLGAVLTEGAAALTPLPGSRFDSDNARRRLADFYGVAVLDAFGDFTRAEIAAAGALLDYVELTQKGKLPHLAAPRRLAQGAVMEIDAATMRNLELFRSLSGARKGSLLSVIDRTVTGAGGRLLARRLAEPLTDPAAISERLEAVAYFVADETPREPLRAALSRCPDMERALSRLSLERGGPRDLAALRDGLALSHEIGAILAEAGRGGAGAGLTQTPLPAGLAACVRDLGRHDALVDRLGRALAPDLPMIARDGGFIAPGFAPELDAQRVLRDEGRRLVAGLQARYVKETGAASLKIRHNNVLGYFIEVPAGQAAKLGTATEGPFIHRQTMASAVRYTTVELGDLESRIAKAADTAVALENALFHDLCAEVIAAAEAVALAARALAALDVASGLARLAVDRRYCRPRVDDSLDFVVRAARHPVVEAALKAAGEADFVTNDCVLAGGGGPGGERDGEGGGPDDGTREGRRLWLLTGPNMAGKSTFLRQNALIAVLAQIGSFVPAEAVRLGVVDRLFSRVGAADDLARGRSTFMVEMVETAVILNQAGPRALVILDEIGRGTATFDGLSIAWAVAEHLHEVNCCRALFATHYHELTALAARLSGVGLHTMRVKEWKGAVVFLHEVAPGAADRSYGIHVAKLAGLPPPVVARAEQVLEDLEAGEQAGALARLADDLPLFTAVPAEAAAPSAVEQALAEVSPDALTPREALELLYRLKELAKG